MKLEQVKGIIMRKTKTENHIFYCAICGKEVYALPRQSSRKRPNFHLKDLYCPWCKAVTKCIEIKDEIQIKTFLENFKEGKYKEYAETFDYASRDSRVR